MVAACQSFEQPAGNAILPCHLGDVRILHKVFSHDPDLFAGPWSPAFLSRDHLEMTIRMTFLPGIKYGDLPSLHLHCVSGPDSRSRHPPGAPEIKVAAGQTTAAPANGAAELQLAGPHTMAQSLWRSLGSIEQASSELLASTAEYDMVRRSLHQQSACHQKVVQALREDEPNHALRAAPAEYAIVPTFPGT
ncbi:hypothetical protein ACVJGD_007986 [Bradyrhizobium sp. USDA 10063]